MVAKIQTHIVILLAAAVWGLLLLLSGVAVDLGWLRFYSAVTGVVVLLLTSFELFLWRLPWLQGRVVKRPNLIGTWRAEFRSNWKDSNTGQGIEPRTAYVAITQTFSSLTFKMMTTESASELLNAQLIPSMDGSYRLLGIYRNEPRLSVRERSAIHNGALLLDVSSAPVSQMTGHYWTDLGTAGELDLVERIDTRCSDYESAKAAFAGRTAPLKYIRTK